MLIDLGCCLLQHECARKQADGCDHPERVSAVTWGPWLGILLQLIGSVDCLFCPDTHIS